MAESGKEFERLLNLIAQLRAEDGCPWDREQTPATIKRYLLEEVYELVDAVDHHAPDQVAEELGDLIFMATSMENKTSFKWSRYCKEWARKWCEDIPTSLAIAR
jgi:uncharacterized protein YabN with tetrapyrrole methylase and pyrophosphatase domain